MSFLKPKITKHIREDFEMKTIPWNPLVHVLQMKRRNLQGNAMSAKSGKPKQTEQVFKEWYPKQNNIDYDTLCQMSCSKVLKSPTMIKLLHEPG